MPRADADYRLSADRSRACSNSANRRNAIPFSATSPSLPGEIRQFNNFTEAAVEDGMSRVYGGVHFGFSVTDGHPLGQNVADVALASFHNSV